MATRRAGKAKDGLQDLKRILADVERGGIVLVNGQAISVRHPMVVELKASQSLVSGELHIALSWPCVPEEGREAARLVGVLGGSRSDFRVLEKAVAVLTQLGVQHEVLAE